MVNWIEIMALGARLVMVILLFLSVWSVSIMFGRRKLYREEIKPFKRNEVKTLIQEKNWEELAAWARRHPSFIGGLILSALSTGTATAEGIDRAVQSYLSEQKLRFESGLNVLATLAANAAFIGLLGTVMGIIQSFGILSSQQGSAMNAVMFGLAEALVTTAIGIFVAVPAAISYNHFSQKFRDAQLEGLAIRDLIVSKKIA